MGLRRLGRIAAIALRNFLRFRLQSFLIVFAASLGVSGILASAGYAAGGQRKILDSFVRLGTNVITISPTQSRAVGARARTGSIVQTLTEQDYRAISANVDGIVASTGMVSGTFRMRAGDLTKTTTVVGADPAYFQMKSWRTKRGEIFDMRDTRRLARVALLGSTVSLDLFGTTDPTGERITINRIPFAVVGVLAERGQGLDAANEDDQVYVPLPTAMHRLMNVDYFRSIKIEAGSSNSLGRLVTGIQTLMHKRHKRFSPISDDFQVQNQTALIGAQISAFTRLSFLIGWIATSALVVSGIGILGLTWISMRNRIQEIGARRAIGATRLDILLQFLAESTIASLTGCTIGLVSAYFSTSLLDRFVEQPFVFAWGEGVLYAGTSLFLFTFFVGISAGRAALLNPIRALQAE